jgi:hypothetical protein
MNKINIARPEPTDTSAPDWVDQIRRRFAGSAHMYSRG